MLASLCRVTISRFYRDRSVFDYIGSVVLPRLADRKGGAVACWSAGCASGEEAYTMQTLWKSRTTPSGGVLRVLGTDSEPHMLERARKAEYRASALKDLPSELLASAFERSGDTFLLKAPFKENVEFEVRNVRESLPTGPFDIILVRNFILTYFEEDLQCEILPKLFDCLREGGVVVTGVHETLPECHLDLVAEAPAIYRLAS
jgi:chemotaxis protein methyltransferase CheR